MGTLTWRVAVWCAGVTLVHCCVFAVCVGGSVRPRSCGRRLTCLPDVSAGRNATRIALGAGDAGVMDAGEWVVLCG